MAIYFDEFGLRSPAQSLRNYLPQKAKKSATIYFAPILLST